MVYFLRRNLFEIGCYTVLYFVICRKREKCLILSTFLHTFLKIPIYCYKKDHNFEICFLCNDFICSEADLLGFLWIFNEENGSKKITMIKEKCLILSTFLLDQLFLIHFLLENFEQEQFWSKFVCSKVRADNQVGN